MDLSKEMVKLKQLLYCGLCKDKRIQKWKCEHHVCPKCLPNFMSLNKCPFCNKNVKIENNVESNMLSQALREINGLYNINYEILIEEKRLDYDNNSIVQCATVKINAKGETPLHIACKKKNFALVTAYIKAQHCVNAQDNAGWAPLHEAVFSNFYEGVKALLESGAVCNIPGNRYVTPLHAATDADIYNPITSDIIKILIQYSANKFARDVNGITPGKKNPAIFCLDNGKRIDCTEKLFLPKLCIFATNLTIDEKEALRKYVKITDKFHDKVTHVILTDDIAKQKTFYILKGIFVTDMEWLNTFLASDGKAVLPKTGHMSLRHSENSVLNKYLGRPPLFSNINFYIIGHETPLIYNDVTYTKKDLIQLITAGGGKVLIRCPTPDTASQSICYPFHYHKIQKHPSCSTFIIFDKNNPPLLQYKMPEIKHKTSHWLLNCIMDFEIIDDQNV